MAVAILLLKLQTSIELLLDLQYNRIFIRTTGKTILIMWLEVQIQSLIVMIPYYIIVSYIFKQNYTEM